MTRRAFRLVSTLTLLALLLSLMPQKVGPTAAQSKLASSALGSANLLGCTPDPDGDGLCWEDSDGDGFMDDQCPDDTGPESNCGCPVEGGSQQVDLIFVMDTSGSMNDEFSALCSKITDIVSNLQAKGISVQYEILGITANLQCTTDYVTNLLPNAIADHLEDWGPATRDVSVGYPWTPGHTRLIVPMSDEGAENGGTIWDQYDTSAVDTAIVAATSNSVRVAPVLCSGYPSGMEVQAQRLADATGGKVFYSTAPADDLANGIAEIVEYVAVDTDGDGTPDCRDRLPEDPCVPDLSACHPEQDCGVNNTPHWDDDGDGRTDEEIDDGLDNDHDTLVDEDVGGVDCPYPEQDCGLNSHRGFDDDDDGSIDEEIDDGIDNDLDNYVDEDVVCPCPAQQDLGVNDTPGVDDDHDLVKDEEMDNSLDDDGDGCVDEDVGPPFRVEVISPLPNTQVYHSDTMFVKAVVTRNGQRVAGADVKGSIALDAIVSVPITMYDDGSHGDGNPADGYYGGAITLYGPLVMPVTDNPYLLSVEATHEEDRAYDALFINLAATAGAPSVVLDIVAPNSPDFFAGDQLAISAIVTYPDGVLRTDTFVTVSIVAPDGSVVLVPLTYISGDTWRGSYTLPEQAGHYYIDVRADPPGGSGYVDRYASEDMQVYLGTMTMQIAPFSDPVKARAALAIEVALNSDDGLPVVEAEVLGEAVTPEETYGLNGFLYEGGYHTMTFEPPEPSTYEITLEAHADDYKPISDTVTLEVVGSLKLAEYLRGEFIDSTIYGDPFVVLGEAKRVAQEGDQFDTWLGADKANRVVDLMFGVISVALAGAEAYHAVTASIEATVETAAPGIGVTFKDLATATDRAAYNFVTMHLPLDAYSYLTELGLDALAEDLRDDALAFYLEDGDWEAAALLSFADESDLAYAKEEYQRHIDGGLQSRFSGSLNDLVYGMAGDTAQWAEEVADDLPYLTETEEEGYLDLLWARQAANRTIAHQFRFYSQPLHMAHDLRVARGLTPVWFYLGRAGIKLSWALINPFGYLAVTTFDTYLAYKYNTEDIEEDEMMRDFAIELLPRALLEERRMWLNIGAGLAEVENAGNQSTPALPQGHIGSVQLTEERVLLWKERVYARVHLSNPADSARTMYYVLVGTGLQMEPEVRYLVFDSAVDAEGRQVNAVELAPGQSEDIFLNFYDPDLGLADEPAEGSRVWLWLLAFDHTGMYSVHADAFYYDPVVETQTLTSSRISSLSGEVLAANDAPSILSAAMPEPVGFPLVSTVLKGQNGDYDLWIEAHNPYPQPVAWTVSHELAPGVMVTDIGDGTIEGQTIRWHRFIEPRETVYLGYSFQYTAAFGVEVMLPPISLGFYDVVDQVTYALSTDPVTFRALPALHAVASAQANVAPFSTATVSGQVINLDPGTSREADLVLTLSTLDGTQLSQGVQHMSLAPDTVQSFNLAYTAPDKGIYLLELVLETEGETITALRRLLKVMVYPLYLPLIMRSYTPSPAPEDPISNGDFEDGPWVGWIEYSHQYFPIVVDETYSLLVPHSGSWLAWLGGYYDETAYVEQTVMIPSDRSYLHFWQWRHAATSDCNADQAGLLVNGLPIIDYALCDSTSTGGWVETAVDLSAYAGQSVALQFRVETSPVTWSSWFIDDVSLQATEAVVGDSILATPDPHISITRKSQRSNIPLTP